MSNADGIDPAHVRAMRDAIGMQLKRSVPAAQWRRMVQLARVVRSPENSAPLTELLDLIEEVQRG